MAYTNKELEELRITGVNPKLKDELNNIAANQGINLTSFLKPKLREIADSYPEKMKQKPAED
jgi:hypothetical protein